MVSITFDSQMEAHYSRLAVWTAKLNADAEAANAVLSEASSRLAKISPGLPFVSIECTVWNDVDDRRKLLGYSYVDDTWQFSVHWIELDCKIGLGDRLMNASREIRVAAARALPVFLKAYADHVMAVAQK